jgi:hypothetical protein
MPQSDDELRLKWGGEYSGVSEEKAEAFLLSRGWSDYKSNWLPPVWKWSTVNNRSDLITEDEWEALDFLIHEWDHAFIHPIADIRHFVPKFNPYHSIDNAPKDRQIWIAFKDQLNILPDIECPHTFDLHGTFHHSERVKAILWREI